MQVTMTERDKKLIVMLSIIVIVVSIGYWGILPAVKATAKAKEEISRQEEIRNQNDIKLAQIPFLEEKIAEGEERLDVLKKDFFPVMNSDQIDKKFTGIVLERGLFAFDLNIKIDPNPLIISPYRYSAMATDAFYSVDTGIDTSLPPESTADPMAAFDEIDNSEQTVNSNIYCAHISFRIGGGKDELMKLIDDLSHYEKALLITSYRWSESTYVEPYEIVEGGDAEDTEDTEELPEGAHIEEDANGAYLVVVREVLELNMDIYMYKEDSAQVEAE